MSSDPRPDRRILVRRRTRMQRLALSLPIALTVLCLPATVQSGEAENPFGDLRLALDPAKFSAEDRLAILNLISAYSHLADGLHTDGFGEFFSKDALFEVVPVTTRTGANPPPSPKDAIPRQRIGKGREQIVESMRARHAEFRRNGVQRRHFLTNPVVWDQTDRSARVAVYLQLRTSTRGGPSKIVGTGRYEGRAIKTLEGWRMAEWRIYADQEIR